MTLLENVVNLLWLGKLIHLGILEEWAPYFLKLDLMQCYLDVSIIERNEPVLIQRLWKCCGIQVLIMVRIFLLLNRIHCHYKPSALLFSEFEKIKLYIKVNSSLGR